MLTLKQFTKHMEELKAYDTASDAVDKAMRNLEPEFGMFVQSRGITLIIDILKDTMNDEHDYISYWIYELKWGTKWTKTSVIDKEGKSIKLKTIEDLYNYLHI